MHALIVGLGVTGEALAEHAAAQGWSFTVVEDTPGGEGHDRRARAVADLGGTVVEAPSADRLTELVAGADLVVPSPGVPASHPVYRVAEAGGVTLVSEIELAAGIATVPIVAVTGTNGKTTVTRIVTDVLRAAGVRAVAAGNIGLPLLRAVLDGDAAVVVAEVSSFQLQYTHEFRPSVAAVLNVGDDHLDWHPSPDHYRQAKERIFANQGVDDVLVLNADDPVVAGMATRTAAQVVWFSTTARADAYCVDGGAVVAPGGERVVSVAELHRAHPHDLANAVAACAVATAAGAGLPAAGDVLRRFQGLPHRLMPVGEAGGVVYYDDSKATNPHATVTAVRDFDSVVLLAGGRNKGLPLAPLAGVADRVRAVVAFGEAAGEIAAVFEGLRPVEQATTMREAVRAAHRLARPGDAVLLSPACASFDAYPDYAARGDDFAAEVRSLTGGSAPADAAGGAPGGDRGGDGGGG